ncbi:MAG: hypothetical protein GY757_47730 [bacterium]|nr:hypothetical protein [bacterium]
MRLIREIREIDSESISVRIPQEFRKKKVEILLFPLEQSAKAEISAAPVNEVPPASAADKIPKARNAKKMKPKLIGYFVFVGLAALLLLGWAAVQHAKHIVMENSYIQLETVRDLKKARIETFFYQCQGDVRVLANNPYVIQAFKELKAAFNNGGGATGGRFRGHTIGSYDAPAKYKEVHDKFIHYFHYYMEQYGYYDVFLMGKEHGDTYFTVTKETDFGIRANKIDSSLKEVWQGAQRGRVQISDMKPYAPSNGAPGQFIAAPIIEKGLTIGIVALQLSLDAINNIMTDTSGLEATCETYLVGPDNLMRSDSLNDNTGNHSVMKSFAGNVKTNGIDSPATRNALSGTLGHTSFLDYNGAPVYSAFAPLRVGDTTWALMAEIEEPQVMLPVNDLTFRLFIWGLLILVLLFILALRLASSFSKGLQQGVEPA